MTRDELLTRLSGLLPSQFEELVFRLAIAPGQLSGTTAPQITRAIEVLRHVENTGGLARLEQLLRGGSTAGPTAPGPAAAAAKPGKHTILFLAANPAGTDHRALDREARAIQIELERSGHRDLFELVTRWAAEPLDLLRELRKLRPAVVHFNGHGDEPGLFFQGESGAPQRVSAEALRDTFGAAGRSVQLVVLSACYIASQAEALLAHVSCVVGLPGTIVDAAARSFAIGFYGGLGDRESVAAAFLQGCAAISLTGPVTGDRPQLATRPGVAADELVLAADPA
jgi:hypothetical protein